MRGKKTSGAKALPKPRCTGVRKDGGQCSKAPLAGKTKCFLHADDIITKKKRAISQFKGGLSVFLPTLDKGEMPTIDFTSRDKIRTLMESLLRLTLEGKVPATVARAAKGILDSNTAFEQLTLNARVLALEEALREEFDIDLPTHEE